MNDVKMANTKGVDMLTWNCKEFVGTIEGDRIYFLTFAEMVQDLIVLQRKGES